MSKDTLYNEVKALLIKFGADQKAIDDLDIRTDAELSRIKFAYTKDVLKTNNLKVWAKYNIPHKL